MLRSLITTGKYTLFNPLKTNAAFPQCHNISRHSSNFKSSYHEVENVEQEVMPTDAEELNFTREIIGKVNEQITSNSKGRLFAVIYALGRQHLITAEDLLLIPGRFHPTSGDRIRLEKVLVVGGRDFTLFGRPLLPKDLVRVEATVVEKTLDSTIVRINYRPRRKPLKMERRPITVLRINRITIDHPVDGLPSVEGVEGRVF